MTELALRKQVQLACSRLGARLFRNNSGVGWIGHVTARSAAGVYIQDARALHAGLAVGSSDLIGYVTVTITPEMVGQQVAIFAAVELKTGAARPTKEQAAFLDAVRQAGGLAGVARTVAEAERICRPARIPMERGDGTTSDNYLP